MLGVAQAANGGSMNKKQIRKDFIDFVNVFYNKVSESRRKEKIISKWEHLCTLLTLDFLWDDDESIIGFYKNRYMFDPNFYLEHVMEPSQHKPLIYKRWVHMILWFLSIACTFQKYKYMVIDDFLHCYLYKDDPCKYYDEDLELPKERMSIFFETKDGACLPSIISEWDDKKQAMMTKYMGVNY